MGIVLEPILCTRSLKDATKTSQSAAPTQGASAKISAACNVRRFFMSRGEWLVQLPPLPGPGVSGGT